MQAYVDAVLDLASHFITRLRRYASFCRTLASHAVNAGTGSNRSMVASPTQNSSSPATSQGQYAINSTRLMVAVETYLAMFGFFPKKISNSITSLDLNRLNSSQS